MRPLSHSPKIPHIFFNPRLCPLTKLTTLVIILFILARSVAEGNEWLWRIGRDWIAQPLLRRR